MSAQLLNRTVLGWTAVLLLAMTGLPLLWTATQSSTTLVTSAGGWLAQSYQQFVCPAFYRRTPPRAEQLRSSSLATCRLSNVWQRRPASNGLTARVARQMRSCHNLYVYSMLSSTGMGSALHIWSQIVCYALEHNGTVHVTGRWPWNDGRMCTAASRSTLDCYFGVHAPCANYSGHRVNLVKSFHFHETEEGKRLDVDLLLCPSIMDRASRTSVHAFRAAAVEYLFSNLSDRLLRYAQRAAYTVFGSRCAPADMISVHIRWGDKHKEMPLKPIADYVAAVERLVSNHSIVCPHIFLSTEDHYAYEQFTEAIRANHSDWSVYTYLPAVNQAYADPAEPTSPMQEAQRTQGAIGTESLTSLLLALEARYYVLTLASNWSRLINELRTNVVDVRCANCTHVIDLQWGDW